MSSNNTQAAAPADSAKPILVNHAWPKEWRDNDENPGTNLDKALADVARRTAYWESLGMPCTRVSVEKSKLVPHQHVNLRVAKNLDYKDRLGTEYVALERKCLPDQPEKPTCYVMEGKERIGLDYAPKPPLDIYKNYNDYRPVDRPTDVISFDKPAADTDRFLERGNKFVSAVMTNNDWRPGQLFGQNGSDPATIAQSPSFAPPNCHNQFSERRSATSTGHLLQHQRPADVSYGWGDYDQNTYWQSFGRRVTKDMVENKNWRKDPMEPINLVDESGTIAQTLAIPFKRIQLSNARKSLSLYEQLNSPDNRKPIDNRKQKAPASGNPARPGASNDNE
ncbi:hypothetical protein TARUN_8932 [Trichoderma arundinaceum]|uniref:Uncharacterized protein n=1 Tax=Trichoderma arundinaceum TaxID=490622 RepID=A0A395NBL6_TRIAR|nr:hypothetical protein TARUN_8932 [Trichoderma arundinaceum]